MADLSQIARYELMQDERPSFIGPLKWCGNDKLIFLETALAGVFELATVPLDVADCSGTGEGDLVGGVPSGIRYLASVRVDVSEAIAVTYRADGWIVHRENDEPTVLTVPPGRRGLLISGPWNRVTVGPSTRDSRRTTVALEGPREGGISIGRWKVSVSADRVVVSDRQISAAGKNVAITFGFDGSCGANSRALLQDAAAVRLASREFWNNYLHSCPLVEAPELSVPVEDDVLLRQRQLWHWWAALVNVSDVEYVAPYVAPDRSRWHGTWSSDGPITMCALALTNQVGLSKRLIAAYFRSSIDSAGDLSWYTHSYGRPGLGSFGDSGVRSHGVPDLVRSLEFIARVSHSPDLYDEDGVGGRTLCETAVWYLRQGFEHRDPNRDGLWEMQNIWEGAWDDKESPFFSAASLPEWVEVMTGRDLSRMAQFIDDRTYPVATMIEQSSLLWALSAVEVMARSRADSETSRWATECSEQILSTISERHWDPDAGAYRDWDVRRGQRNTAINLDCFYYLAFERDQERVARLADLIADPDRFGLRLTPTLDRNHPAFDPGGYWKGSYWPRESLYVAIGLSAHGYRDHAATMLLSSLLSSVGSEILEHINSQDGSEIGFHRGNSVKTQAMSVGLCLGLIEVARGGLWHPGSAATEKPE